MNDNRDMFYSGYQTITPLPNMNMYPNNLNNTYPNNTPNNYYNNIESRLNRIENQIKSINQRLIKLETPYNNYNNEPDNNMYMM